MNKFIFKILIISMCFYSYTNIYSAETKIFGGGRIGSKEVSNTDPTNGQIPIFDTTTNKYIFLDLYSLGTSNIIYVAKWGNDSNNGKSYNAPKLTITSACTTAVSGDTIKISPGTYTEANISIPTNVNLIGYDRDNTIIGNIASSDNSGILILPASSSHYIANLTIYETSDVTGTLYREGITLPYSSTTVIIENCHIEGSWDAIYMKNVLVNQNVTVKNSTIKSVFDGIGFWSNSSNLTVLDSQIITTGSGAVGVGERCIALGNTGVSQVLYVKNCIFTATTDNNNGLLAGIQNQTDTTGFSTTTVLDSDFNITASSSKVNAYGILINQGGSLNYMNCNFNVTGATNNFDIVATTAGVINTYGTNRYLSSTNSITNNTYECIGKFLNILTVPKLLISFITPATSEIDYSGNSHTATYVGFTLADKLIKNNVWSITLNGTSQYLTVPDNDDFSFGDGSNDTTFTVGGWVEVVQTATLINILTKYNSNASLREWTFNKTTDNKIELVLYDQSASAVSCRMVTNSAITNGWHFIVATYSGVGGGTAGNGITIYVDGVSVASTATNNGSYVAMENLTALLNIGSVIGSGGTQVAFWNGDLGIVFISQEQLSAANIWKLYISTRGYYGL